MNKYYSEKLAEGKAYESFILCQFKKLFGMSWNPYNTAEQQLLGENDKGIEIKLDMQLKYTGNLYIEIAEKTDENNPYYVGSGIFRIDNTFWYLIGNYDECFIFAKKRLLNMCLNFDMKTTPTSKGFIIPIDKALKISAKHIEFKGEEI